MSSVLYRASFFLYEISFVVLAVALWYHSLSMRKINQAMHMPPYWIFSALGAALLIMCSFNHYFVYHFLSPQYLQTQAQDLLVRMYIYKTLSMVYVLGSGVLFVLSNGLYLRRISK